MTPEEEPPAPSAPSAPGQDAEPSAAQVAGSSLAPRGLISPPLAPNVHWWKRGARMFFRLGQGLYFHDAFDAAPAMAFHVFLSLLPLLVFLGYVLGSIARKQGVEAVLWPVLDSLPREAEGVVRHEVDRLAGASTLAPLAAIGFLWIASGGVHGLMNALETVVSAPRRPFWKKRVLALAWVVGSLLVVTVASFGVVEWNALVHPPSASAGHRIHREISLLRTGGERALALGISLAGSVGALAAFFRFSVAHPRQVKRRVLPGAALAIALWIVTSWAFGLYVRTLTDYAVFYGSLAAVAVLMLWLWLACLAVLVGAELNAQLEGLRD